MAQAGNINVTLNISVTPEGAKVLLSTAKAEEVRALADLSLAKKAVETAQARYDAAVAQVKAIDAAIAPRTLVGTREYQSDSRIGVKHTVTKYRKGTVDEYECTCEAYRFSKASPKFCKHTARGRYDWFVTPRLTTQTIKSSPFVTLNF